MEPRRLQFLHTQGPVARIEWRKGTQILRAGKILPAPRGNPRNGRFCLPQGVTPVMGSGADSPCQGEMSRSDRGDRVGDYEHEALIWSRPRWRFGSFAAMGKGTRRPQAAKLSPNDK